MKVALEAVRKASVITKALQPSNNNNNNKIQTVSKTDLSPVTVADFAVQATVLKHLRTAFPNDSFIAEESSQALKDDSQLAERVQIAVNSCNNENNKDGDCIEMVQNSIDLGKEYESWDEKTGRPSRVWVLDPIDGTKGFLRGQQEGGQYCIALALLEDGIPTIGVLACPNLPQSPPEYVWTHDDNNDEKGCIFVASKGCGCYQLSLEDDGSAKRIYCTPNSMSMASKNKDGAIENTEDTNNTSQRRRQPQYGRFCIGVERGFGDALGQCIGTAKVLHGSLTTDGEIRDAQRLDSQAKYGILARAGAEYYARFPKPGYVEWIWDQAAGYVVLTEAGGQMTDTDGDAIDFSLGAQLSPKVKGVLGSNGGDFHEALLQAFGQQEKERKKKEGGS